MTYLPLYIYIYTLARGRGRAVGSCLPESRLNYGVYHASAHFGHALSVIRIRQALS